MSKLLKDVTDYLKETQGLSMSQISKDLGKGRNYIREAIERDISMDKQMEILFSLYCRGLGYKDLLDIIQQQATKYQATQEQADEFERQLISVNEENRKLEKECGSLKRKLDNSDRLYCESQSQRKDLEQRLCNATAKNKELEHQIVVLQKKIDEDQKEYVKGEVAQGKVIDYLNGECSEYLDKLGVMSEQEIELKFELSNARRKANSLQKSKDNWFTLSLTLFFALFFTSLALRFLN